MDKKEEKVLNGTAVVDGLTHKVVGRRILCDHSLNFRRWNVAESTGNCPECFKPKEQLKMF